VTSQKTAAKETTAEYAWWALDVSLTVLVNMAVSAIHP